MTLEQHSFLDFIYSSKDGCHTDIVSLLNCSMAHGVSITCHLQALANSHVFLSFIFSNHLSDFSIWQWLVPSHSSTWLLELQLLGARHIKKQIQHVSFVCPSPLIFLYKWQHLNSSCWFFTRSIKMQQKTIKLVYM